ncbi:MAG TPA: SDR family oxidoreductase [Planctomycetaceae bacterium]|nr:SDR family oxidoreductase [Planctomycetaceae bacterium]
MSNPTLAFDDSPGILMTGGTGLLGRYLLRDLALANRPVAVIVRRTRNQTAVSRVESLFRTWETRLGLELPRPVVLEGDLTQPQLGLLPEQIDWIKQNCDSVLHNAASLTFVSGSREGEPWVTNVGGTQNVLDVCQEANIDQFHHVSTAYVCGRRQGTVLETELNEGQELSNDYELSKIESEQLVRNASFLRQVTVYRPGIIVGDSESGLTTTFHGFYATLRLVHTIRKSAESNHFETGETSARLNLNGDERKNLIPVDWVSEAITRIIGSPEHHGQTYHLTSDSPVTSKMILDVVDATCGLNGTARFVGASSKLENPTELERLFYENMRVYEAYWRNDPVFDTSNTRRALPELPCPVIDEDRLMMLAKSAIDLDFRWKDVPVPDSDQVLGSSH